MKTSTCWIGLMMARECSKSLETAKTAHFCPAMHKFEEVFDRNTNERTLQLTRQPSPLSVKMSNFCAEHRLPLNCLKSRNACLIPQHQHNHYKKFSGRTFLKKDTHVKISSAFQKHKT